MSKDIRFSDHSQLKLEVLKNHGLFISSKFVRETINSPDKLEIKENNKRIAQKRFNENLVIRIVYREFSTFILIITLYPGKKSRYEKNKL
ncbi:MAG: DUF4258 domain-containing protein [Xenococcus sp. (in: cyanobacteria)]